jgi:hypothetical protein
MIVSLESEDSEKMKKKELRLQYGEKRHVPFDYTGLLFSIYCAGEVAVAVLYKYRLKEMLERKDTHKDTFPFKVSQSVFFKRNPFEYDNHHPQTLHGCQKCLAPVPDPANF